MAYRNLYSTEYLDVHVDADRGTVQLEAASSGYRPRYVTVEIEHVGELDKLIAALLQAKAIIEKQN